MKPAQRLAAAGQRGGAGVWGGTPCSASGARGIWRSSWAAACRRRRQSCRSCNNTKGEATTGPGPYFFELPVNIDPGQIYRQLAAAGGLPKYAGGRVGVTGRVGAEGLPGLDNEFAVDHPGRPAAQPLPVVAPGAHRHRDKTTLGNTQWDEEAGRGGLPEGDAAGVSGAHVR